MRTRSPQRATPSLTLTKSDLLLFELRIGTPNTPAWETFTPISVFDAFFVLLVARTGQTDGQTDKIHNAAYWEDVGRNNKRTKAPTNAQRHHGQRL